MSIFDGLGKFIKDVAEIPASIYFKKRSKL